MDLNIYKVSLKKIRKSLRKKEVCYFDLEILLKYYELYISKKGIKYGHKILDNFMKKENCSILENRNDRIALTNKDIVYVSAIIKKVAVNIPVLNKILNKILIDKIINAKE